MLKVNDREWKEYKISDIFCIEDENKKIKVPTGAYVHKNLLERGNTPRITVTSLNNGIDCFCNSSDRNYRVFNNFISVSFLGTVFYQPYYASLDMKVHCLKIKDKILNKNLSLFLITEIKNSIKNASYGNQLSSTDLPHVKLLLPINKKGNPDYEFMEQFIKEREEIKKKEYIEYAKKKIKELKGNLSIF